MESAARLLGMPRVPRAGTRAARKAFVPVQERVGRARPDGTTRGVSLCRAKPDLPFSLGRNFVDAITDLGCAGFTDEQAENMQASVDHVPCSQCLARMTMREDTPS